MVSCSSCGSKSSQNGSKCDHCGGQLSKLLCQACFYPLPASAAFCMLCGVEQTGVEHDDALSDLACPVCSAPPPLGTGGPVTHLLPKIITVPAGKSRAKALYYECQLCHGNWTKVDLLIRMLLAARVRKTMVAPEPRVRTPENRPYFICPHPDCGQMLARVRWDKFGSTSRSNKNPVPIVDKCAAGHGVWLDNGELDWLLELGQDALLAPAKMAELGLMDPGALLPSTAPHTLSNPAIQTGLTRGGGGRKKEKYTSSGESDVSAGLDLNLDSVDSEAIAGAWDIVLDAASSII